MKRTGLLVFAVCSLAASAYATPYPATWRREVLIGSNAESYFVMVLTWEQDGSYYDYRAGVSLERRSFVDHAVLDTRELSAFEATDAHARGQWSRVPEHVMPLEIVDYLLHHEMSPVFSEDYAYNATLEEGGLVLVKDDRAVQLLSPTELETQLPVPIDTMYKPRVLPICQKTHTPLRSSWEETWFYTLRSGEPAWDLDWYEVVVAVPGARVEEATDMLGEDRR